MPVTQRLMKPGRFRVELVDDYPWSATNAVDLFDHIVITPNRLEPISGFSDANILASALYTGVVINKASPRIFEGHDLSYWLGTPSGTGDILDTAVTNTTATLTTWVNALRPASLSAGTVTNTSTHTGTYQWMTRREALDAVCKATTSEWRVNPTGTLDAGAIANLFVTTPTVVVTRKEEGQDGAYRGLDGSLIVTAKDADNYATKVFVAGPGEGASMLTASATGSTTYKDLLNGAVVLEKIIDAPNTDATTISTLASAMVALFNAVRRELSVASSTYAVSRFVKPGDYVWFFDHLAELTDAANQIVYRGEVITPIKQRVYGLTWPVERGMGVYARRSAATPTYTDLTDWIQWENSDVQWDIGAPPNTDQVGT